MNCELLQHQREGVDFLASRESGLLAFEQGLGKTLVAIETFCRFLQTGRADRMLVVCPNSLKRNWLAEFGKFAPSMPIELAEGSPLERRTVFLKSHARVIVTSYETARAEITALMAFLQRQKTVLVLDESHAAKNRRSQTSNAVRLLAPHAAFRWLLSGTPVTNTAADLHTQVEIIAPNQHLLGSLESFNAQMKRDPEVKFAKDILEPLILRRTKEQCLDLPKKSFIDIKIDLPSWQRRLYDDMRDRMICEIRSMSGEQYCASAPTILSKITRLMQIACNPAIVPSFPEIDKTPAKFEELDNIIENILSVPGRKLILWSNYIKSIEMLLERFSGSVAIYGKISTSERHKIAEQFQNNPDVRVLIANPAAAGSGFTLTAANFTIYESLSWRYDHYAQSQDRNHRIGQEKPVTYMRLLATDTIEEAVISALERKSVLAHCLLGDKMPGNSILHLTKEEMCEFLETNQFPFLSTRVGNS